MFPRHRSWRLLLAGVALAYLAAYAVAAALAPGTPPAWASAEALKVLQLSAALWTWVAAVRAPRRERVAWSLVAAGMTGFSLGDTVWELLGHPELSLADPLFLSFPVLVTAGLALLLRDELRDADAGAWLDGLATALGAAAVGMVVVSGPALERAMEQHGTALVVNAAYPATDLVLLTLLICAFTVAGSRFERRFVLLGGGVAAFWLADSLYLRAASSGTYDGFAWFEPGWTLALLLLAAAARAPAPEVRGEQAGWRRRAFVTGTFAGAAIALLDILALRSGTPGEAIPVVALSTLCLGAVVARQTRSLRDHERAREASEDAARTDALTGLGNRRALNVALRDAVLGADDERPVTLALFDLDGFKAYNDLFGHAAGDDLLRRLGASLAQTLDGHGEAFRMGGDEFCVLLAPHVRLPDAAIRTAATALSEDGEGFRITASHGAVTLPGEATTAEAALRLADQRMYAHKRGGRASAGRQTTDALLAALAERDGALGGHTDHVAALAERVARRLGLADVAVEEVVLAAKLHDIGKVAIPDAVLQKPAPLDDAEWAFVRRHTVIGERILSAAPALSGVARLVRATHERWDGTGYPDALAGEAIPLGARIVFACDAYDAMCSDRAYQAARGPAYAAAEVARCAGTQFDPRVAAALVEELAEVPALHLVA